MKNLLVILFFISNFLGAQNILSDNTAPSIFTTYKVPETSLNGIKFQFGATYDGSASAGSIVYDSSPTVEYQNSKSRNLSLNFNPSGFYLNETDDQNLNINWSISNEYTDYKSKSNQQQINNNSESKISIKQFSPIFALSFQTYYDKNLLFFISFTHSSGFNYQENYDEVSNSSSFQNNKSSRSEINRTHSFNNSLGFGFGKIRNITSVISAIRFQERLKKTNSIDQDFSEETILSLSEQISRNKYYGSVYARGGKFFWNDVDPILEHELKNYNSMNSFSKLYAFEALSEIKFIRKEGYYINFGINSSYYNTINSFDEFPGIYSESLNESNSVGLFLSGEYSHQLSLNAQLRSDFNASGSPQLSKLNSLLQIYRVNFNCGFDYEVTDNFVNSINAGYQFTKLNDEYINSSYSNVVELTNKAQFFIEDNLSLNTIILLNWKKYEGDLPDFLLPAKENISTYSNQSFSIGLTYYFDRAFIGDFVNSNPLK